MNNRRNAVINLAARLESLSPLAVLARGYSVTLRSETGAVIRDSRSVAIGEDLLIKLHVGELGCRVIDKTSPKD
jgi:exodeoxyribonuclease VII large subunit